MGIWLIIAMALPVLELVGIYWVWRFIGPWTLLWLALAAVAGLALIRQEHASLAPRLAHALLHGQAPLSALLGIGLRFLAGVLLILPGALSDAVALVLLLFTPGRIAPLPPGPPPGAGRARADDVIEGDYRRID